LNQDLGTLQSTSEEGIHTSSRSEQGRVLVGRRFQQFRAEMSAEASGSHSSGSPLDGTPAFDPAGTRIDLSHHAALVTGAGRGIGRAIAIRLARAGARIAVAAR